MKILVVLISFLATTAFASIQKITVQIPEGASQVSLFAKDVVTDGCNSYGLYLDQDKGALEEWNLWVFSTELFCPDVKEKGKMDLDIVQDLLPGSQEFILNYSGKTIHDLKIDFK